MTHADFCRPFHDRGLVVETVNAQLRARARAQHWTLATTSCWTGVHLDVDGTRVEPVTRGTSARFALPADATDVWLVSPTFVPAHVCASADRRALGLDLNGMVLDDGFTGHRVIALDDVRLDDGCHAFEKTHRWTSGRAKLPVSLWSGLSGEVSLRLVIGRDTRPIWVVPEKGSPGDTADAVPVEPARPAEGRLSLVAAAAPARNPKTRLGFLRAG